MMRCPVNNNKTAKSGFFLYFNFCTLHPLRNPEKTKNMQKNYTNEEWEIISSLPQLTGLLMSCAVYSGEEGTKDELEVSIRSILDGKKKYYDNQLIASLIPEGKNDDEILASLKQQQAELIENTCIKDDKSVEKFQNNSLKKYLLAINYLSRRETSIITIREFRYWILSIAEQVAVAAIENGELFSEKERILFSKIENVLDLNK